MELLEQRLLRNDHFEGGDADVPLAGHHVILAHAIALLLVAVESDGPHVGAEALDLVHPVPQRGLGHRHQMRPRDAAILGQVAQEGDGLHKK